MPGVTLTLDVDDAAMKAAVEDLSRRGLMAASRRAVLKTARIARAALVGATRGAMHDQPGGYAPFSPAAFKTPRSRSEPGGVSAGTGYTSAGYADRFRSSGTAPRYRHSTRTVKGRFGGFGLSGYTGIEAGLGMLQTARLASDPVFASIADAELQAEIVKEGLA